MRKFRSAIAAALAIAATAAALAAPAAQASVRPLFTCPDHSVCDYQNTDYTGAVYYFDAHNPGNEKVWISLGAQKGSVNNNTNAALEVWDASTGGHYCIPGNTREDLHNGYGWEYSNYGDGNCDNVPPF